MSIWESCIEVDACDRECSNMGGGGGGGAGGAGGIISKLIQTQLSW